MRRIFKFFNSDTTDDITQEEWLTGFSVFLKGHSHFLPQWHWQCPHPDLDQRNISDLFLKDSKTAFCCITVVYFALCSLNLHYLTSPDVSQNKQFLRAPRETHLLNFNFQILQFESEGDTSEQTRYCFDIYDLNSDGYISRKDLKVFICKTLPFHIPEADCSIFKLFFSGHRSISPSILPP